MMIFFNDPIKLDTPTENAMRMAFAMQEKFVPLRASWKRRGYDLELGIGIAQGYATLGAIGFDGRWDYACIGSVTNLAARLCSAAKGGQILTNQKTLATVEESAQVELLGEVTFEGISRAVLVFNVTGFGGDTFLEEEAPLETFVRNNTRPVVFGDAVEEPSAGDLIRVAPSPATSLSNSQPSSS